MSNIKNTKKYINKYLKISLLMLVDVLFVNLSAFLTLFVHFDFNIHSELFQKYATNYYSHIISSRFPQLLFSTLSAFTAACGNFQA